MKELEKIIKKRLKKVNDEEMYSPKQILKLGVILNSKFEPTLDRVYKLVKLGLLPAKNLGDKQPNWFVTGKDLREFVEKKYIIKT